jgi:3-methylcrotonyl-CoA carboxylase alpha subunit
LARHEYFQKGDVHTGFIPQHFDTLFPKKTISNENLAQAAIGLIVNENNAVLRNALRAGQFNDPFALNNSFRVNSNEIRTVKFNNEGKEEKICVMQNEEGLKVKVNDGEWQNVHVKTIKDEGRFTLKVSMNGSVSNFSVVITPQTVTIFNMVSYLTH